MFPSSTSLVETMTTDPWGLYDLLGGFWREQISDTELLKLQCFAELQNAEDALLVETDMVAAIGIQTVAPFRTRQWWGITLKESDLTIEPNIITYGSPGIYYNGAYVYGQPAASSYAWTLPGSFASIGVIMSSIIAPLAVWDVSSFSYDPSTSVLRFNSNPFTVIPSTLLYNSDGTALTYTDAGGNVVQDKSIHLWIRNIGVDARTPYLRYGSVIGIPGVSSQPYIDVLKATWSMLLQGPSAEAFERGLLASAGLRFVEGTEVVELIENDIDGVCVVTDQAVYRGALGSGVLVSVGDTINRGDFIFDTVTITDFGSGVPDDLSTIPALILNPSLADITGTVVVPNKTGTWTVVGTLPNGVPDVRFEVLGDPGDIKEFWDGVNARGLASGAPLSNFVNTLAPVNPLQFVIDNVLGKSLIFVTLKPQHFLVTESGFLDRVHKLIPAGVLVVTQIVIDPVSDSLTLSAQGSTEQTNEAAAGIPGATVDVVTAMVATSAPQDSIGFTDYEPKVWNAQ